MFLVYPFHWLQELLDDTIGDGEYEEVDEGIHPTASYASFLNRPHSTIWGIEETRRFYEVWGEDTS